MYLFLLFLHVFSFTTTLIPSLMRGLFFVSEGIIEESAEYPIILLRMKTEKGIAMHIDNITVGRRIANYRKLKGLKQKELAALAGIRSGYLSRIETGKQAGKITVLARIAWALGVSLNELLGDG
jgi:DNA-binding XRE family transcriptional regulator